MLDAAGAPDARRRRLSASDAVADVEEDRPPALVGQGLDVGHPGARHVPGAFGEVAGGVAGQRRPRHVGAREPQVRVVDQRAHPCGVAHRVSRDHVGGNRPAVDARPLRHERRGQGDHGRLLLCEFRQRPWQPPGGRAQRGANQSATYAKRFAAKEACAKALGTGMRRGVFWRDIGVVNLASGRPTLQLTGGALERLRAITPKGTEARIDLTITDEWPLAQAFVVISAVMPGSPSV